MFTGYRLIRCLVLLLAVTGSLALHAPARAAAPWQATVDGMLAAYGGRAKLAAIRTVAAHGRLDDLLRKTSGGYARSMRRPGGLRIDLMPEQGGEVRILDGERGLQGSGNRLAPANPVSLASMHYQYAYLDLPMSLADGRAHVTALSSAALHGRTLQLLTVETPEAPPLRVYVDPQTFLIARVEADFAMGGMGSMQLGTEYGDYRPVDGVLFPFTLHNYAGGKISQITLSDIRLNQPLPTGTFPE